MFETATAPMTSQKNQVQKEQVNVVFKTANLDQFTTISGNRTPNPAHIKRLVDSIKKYGVLCNPILVNEKMQVIDGQHRLMACRETQSDVYYIILPGYNLDEVHTLNLNQKNWSKKDFMFGYANMGIQSYVNLANFVNVNSDYNFNDCIALCSNISSAHSQFSKHQKPCTTIFEEGTWVGKDFKLAQVWASKIRELKPHYPGYNRTSFVGVMIQLLQNPLFNFSQFLHKVSLQPGALRDCANREQYRNLIHDIYNWRSSNKIDLRH
jgi:hypothetical protein